MAFSEQMRVGELVYLVDVMISPLLKERERTSTNEVLELALLESFLWVRTGASLGLFPADQAIRALDYTLKPILPTFEGYARKGILSKDIARLFADYLETHRLRGEGETTIEQRNVFLGALDSTAEYLCRFSARSFIEGLHFTTRDNWNETLLLPLQEDLLAAAADEYEAMDCNNLTKYAAGAVLALEHMMAVESLEGYDQPALLNMLRKIRDWSFNLDRGEARERYTLLTRVIQERANIKASLLLEQPILLNALADVAAERMQIWQKGAQTAYPPNIGQQVLSGSSLAGQKQPLIQKDHPVSAWTKGKTDLRIPTSKIYFYYASSIGLAGELIRPMKHSIPAKAAAVLPSIGGSGSQRVENFRSDGIVSFNSAYAEVGGSYDDCHDLYTTSTVSVVEQLNIADMVTADRIVSRLSVYASASTGNNTEPSFDITGSYFENLKIAGHPIDVRLATDVFHRYDTHSRIAKNSQEINEWLWGSQLRNLPENKLRDLEETYRSLTGISTKTQEWKKPAKRSTNGQGYLLSPANHLQIREQSELKNFGSIICVPKFGVVRLAELRVNQYQRHFDLLRVNLEGTAEGIITAGSTSAGGYPV